VFHPYGYGKSGRVRYPHKQKRPKKIKVEAARNQSFHHLLKRKKGKEEYIEEQNE
jgi:hypothetical protein